MALSSSAGNDAKSMVLQAIDVVELIGGTVKLKRRGKDYVGLCPFHQEKTPSFHVKPDKQFFICYGCKAAGNAIDFVMKRDRVEFIEALKLLGRHAGVDLPRFGGTKEKTTERQAMLDAHATAVTLFEKLLSHPQMGRSAREYLKQRGFDSDTLKTFHIGYAPESWDFLLTNDAMKKFPPTLLQQAGLVKARESDAGHYDTFRNRIIFPIRDESGRTIAFGGRAMPGSQDPAKYLNSPETPLFSKSKSIFGIDVAKQKIVETRSVAIVEGYTDVVMAHQYGATNVVSILGTAMTQQHVALLRRFADRIVLLFDPDAAGDAAINRAVELFLTQPVEIAIASIPHGLDPDEFLLKSGLEEFQKLLESAQDALSYKWKQLVREFEADASLTGQQRAVSNYLELLASARGSGPIDALRWGSSLARVSRLTSIPAQELHRRFRVSPAQRRQRQSHSTEAAGDGSPGVVESTKPKRPETADDRVQRWILGVLLIDPQRWADVQQHIAPQDFTDELRARLAEIYWNHQRDEGEPIFSEFIGSLDDPELASLAGQLVDEIELLDTKQALNDALDHVKQMRRRRTELELAARLQRTSPQAGDAQQVEEIQLLRQLQEKVRQPDLRRITSTGS